MILTGIRKGEFPDATEQRMSNATQYSEEEGPGWTGRVFWEMSSSREADVGETTQSQTFVLNLPPPSTVQNCFCSKGEEPIPCVSTSGTHPFGDGHVTGFGCGNWMECWPQRKSSWASPYRQMCPWEQEVGFRLICLQLSDSSHTELKGHYSWPATKSTFEDQPLAASSNP